MSYHYSTSSMVIGAYNDQAAMTNQPAWPVEVDASWQASLNPPQLDDLIGHLSPIPRPLAEEQLLAYLLIQWVTRGLPYPVQPEWGDAPWGEKAIEEDLSLRQSSLQKLAAVIDWPVHDQDPRQASLAYMALDDAISNGTFDMALPVLYPHTTAADQQRKNDLLSSRLGEAEAGNPVACNINAKLSEHTPPIEMGRNLLHALIDNDSQRFFYISEGQKWPLPIGVMRARKTDEQRHTFDQNLTQSLQTSHNLDERFWDALLEACDGEVDIAPTLRWAMEPDEAPGLARWQAWWLGTTVLPDRLHDQTHISAMVLAAYADMRNTLAPLKYLIERWDGTGFSEQQQRFVDQLVFKLADEPTRMRYEYGPSRSREDEEANRAHRLARLDEVLEFLPAERIPGAVFALMTKAVTTLVEYEPWKTRFKDALLNCGQTWSSNLVRNALYQNQIGSWAGVLFKQPSLPTPMASELAEPDLVGHVLVSELAGGKNIHAIFGDPDQWPLPVAQVFADYVDFDTCADDVRTSTREAEAFFSMIPVDFTKGIAAALVNEDYPVALRKRLYEACRPLRPLIAEHRFLADDRQRALDAIQEIKSERRRPRA